MSDDAAMTALRHATENSHATLETLPAMRRLMAQDYSIGEYSRLLQQFKAVYRSIEPLMVSSDECRAIGYAQRLPRIETALNVLQANDPFLPDVQGTGMDLVDTSARRWGCLYVIEGSILGGQMIRRHLSSVFPGYSEQILAPFVPYENPGLQWQKFRENLRNVLANEAQRQQAVESALMTFDIFRRILSRIA
jgi:heme oxygenase (biliverdin-IX-beta and delta-forming)